MTSVAMPLKKSGVAFILCRFFESELHTLMNVRTAGRHGCYYQQF